MTFIPQAATSIARDVEGIFLITWWITTGILIVVWGALAIAVWRFRGRPGREPRQFHSHLGVEIVWTVVPLVLLLMIAVPSYRVVNRMAAAPETELTVEIIGHQFYWEYRYPDHGVTIQNEPLRLPVDTDVKLLVSSADVVHSWSIPSFGFKQDAIPGRVNDVWVRAERMGTFQGYCVQLCGVLHANMLTQVHVMARDPFDAWLGAQARRRP